jgi:hypothetical protein
MIMQPIQSSLAITAANPGSSLSAPSSLVCDGDPEEEMAALGVETGESERTEAHQQRDAEEAAEAKANAAEVQAMHDEASSMRAQGVFDAATAVVGAWVDLACPAAGAGAAAATGSSTGRLVADHVSDGLGKLGDGWWRASQHSDEATAAADRASAAQHADAAKDAADVASDANTFISATLDFDRNYTSIQAQTQLAALHRA